MSLQRKTIVVTLLILALCLAVLFATARVLLGRGFATIQTQMVEGFGRVEMNDARQNVQRVLDALNVELENSMTKLSDWACWDDTYNYALDHNRQYQINNLTETGIANLKINFWAIYDPRGFKVWEQTYDRENGALVPTPADVFDHLKPGMAVIRHDSIESKKTGILLLKEHPMLVASMPILTNEAKGPSHGAFLFGKYLDEELISHFSSVTHLSISFTRMDGDGPMPIDRKNLDSLLAGKEILVVADNPDTISGYALVRDFYGKPGLLLKVDIPRSIYKQGQATLGTVARQANVTLTAVMIGLVVAGLLLGLLIIWYLHSSVLVRLSRLSKWAESVGSHKDFSGRFAIDNKDELGSLAQSINAMLDSLAKAHGKILEDMEEIKRQEEIRKAMEAEKKELQAQLQQAQKMEAIGLLAGGIAHDFNNMLAAISGFAEIIQTKFGATNSVLNSFSGTILDTSRRAADLTGKLLSFARKGKIEVVSTDVNAVVRDVMGLMKHTIDPRIILTEQLSPAPILIMADRTQLQNAIMNLAVNARDAMPDGGAMTFGTQVIFLDERYVQTHPYKVITGHYVRITVTDTGVGMDKETQSKLFEPFFTTKDLGKGTGLGLASVYGTVKSHSGSIEVYSEPGHGTTFKIYLPLAGSPASEEAKKPVMLRRGHGRILLIDDEMAVREMYKAMLEELGYAVFCAKNGEEGAAWFREHWKEIDLVILDVIMPIVGGLECLKRLKEANPDVKVIISSGYQVNGEAQKMLDLGARSYVQKPMDMIRISNLVYDLLNEKK